VLLIKPIVMLLPKETLSEQDVQKGLKIVIWDGLAAEVMTVFSSGTFLVSMALLLGANSMQIGLLAALPLATNVFQLASIWLVGRYHNRRIVAVLCAYFARVPLLLVGLSVLVFSGLSLDLLIFMLFFHYVFGSIAGPSWNSWMKDMVPENMLGEYFSRRSRYTQTLNVVLSIALALLLDYVKSRYPDYQLGVYALFFMIAGSIGLVGGFILSKAQEPQSYLSDSNVFALFKSPLKNPNFRRLLVFNCAWAFALNIATPFFTVFMLTSLKLPISYVIILGVAGQLAGILTLQLWGTFSDRYSNKSIIAATAPLYIVCILAWCFVGIYTHQYANVLLLLAIHVFSGFAAAGINLSLNNIGLKLAPKKDAIVYLSVKNIVVAVASSLGPLVGGMLAVYFAERKLLMTIDWNSPIIHKTFKLLELHEWNFLFVIGALLALVSLNRLSRVKELGEIHKNIVRRIMRRTIRNNLRDYFLIGDLIAINEQLKASVRARRNKHKGTGTVDDQSPLV
jgi:MFS family permease